MKRVQPFSNSEFRVSNVTVRNGLGYVSRFTFHASRAAFTLIEVMIVVVLMSVIILGLMAMFSQTQRALKAGMTQTDVLEGGRMASEMIARELEQIVPGYSTKNLGRTNFLAVLETEFAQTLPANNARRTNLLSQIFFLTHENQTWTGIGYFLVLDATVTPANPVGVLNRFEQTVNAAEFGRSPWLMISNFNRAIIGANYAGNVSKILDGVVSFNVRTYDTNGYWINPSLASTPIGQIWTHSDWSVNLPIPKYPPRADYHFVSNAVPAYVEFELGILEQGALDHYKSIPVSDVQSNYLAQQAARVQLFRQRVSVRNVDRSAY